MKVSVIIIARNEEKYIEKCILSLLNQTQKPNEIILIAHNCSDNTVSIAEKYADIKVYLIQSEPLIINARIEGITKASGEIILCIDGDSFASPNWIECMIKTLEQNQNILVGSWVKFRGTLFGQLSNYFNKYYCNRKNSEALHFIWGPSLGFFTKDREKVIEFLNRSTTLSSNLKLSRNPEDFWLALFMYKIGNIEVTNKTHVTQNQKEKSSIDAIMRNFENIRNGKQIEKFLKTTNN